MSDIIPNRALLTLSGTRYTLSYENVYVDTEDLPDDGEHIHHCAELYLHLDGDVSFLVKNKMYSVSRGDVILTRANDFHHCVYNSSCVHKHFCLWLSEEDGLLSYVLSEGSHRVRPAIEERETLIEAFFELYDATRNEDTLGESAAVLRIFKLLRKAASSTPQRREDSLPTDFQRILDYINENYGELTNAQELCGKFFISPSTLNRWFTKHLRVSPKSYLESVKLSEAKRMLDKGKNVTNTCFDCGFSDLSHFIRVFKKKFGTTPKAYKNPK